MHLGGKYEYERVEGVQDDQNRSVRGVLKKGAVFEFGLEFENLHPLELGALLWALELEPGMHHRLGYGRPLGFGSVTLKVDRLEVLDPVERYSDLSSDGWQNRLADKEYWIADFTKGMQDWYGQEAHNAVLAELRALLSVPPSSLPVHYPRESPIPTKEGENFRWFVKNKRRTDPHALDLAIEDSGLPIRP
jgi:CRISPR-associated protein (TIGR03986 family)